jgi:hypothetical protein
MISDANAEATRIKGEAHAKVGEYFKVFQENPDLAKFLLNLDALDRSTKSRTTLIFDQHSQPFNLFQGYTTNFSTGK